MSVTVVVLLRLVHLIFGGFWVGGAIVTGFFLLPTVIATGPIGGQFVGSLMRRTRLTDVLMWAGIAALLSGAALYWNFYRSAAWTNFGPHVVLALGGSLALLALLLGILVAKPTAARLGAVGQAIQQQGTPPTPAQATERDRLLRRLTNVARFNAVLLVLTVAGMAVARYA